MKSNKSSKTLARHQAREYAVQAMYQWQMAGTDIATIETEFFEDNDFKTTDVEYFKELLYGIPQQASELDEKFKPYLVERSLAELGMVELAILRLASFELIHRLDVPHKVILNEAVELAKTFGATESHKFINGVLDKLAQVVRVDV